MSANTELIDAYRAWLVAGNRAAGTVRLRTHYMARLADAHNLATVDALELLTWIAAPEWAGETRKSARASLVGFFGWAHDWGHRPDNPALQLPRVIVPRSLPKPTPESVLEAALAGASGRDRIMLMAGAYAGLRRAEIARMRWADIDGGRIRVTGKGGRVRVVPLAAILSRELDAELRRRQRGQVGTGWRYVPDPASPYILPGARGTAHIHPETVGAVLKALLGDGWTGHTLRHRFGTMAHAGTRDLRAVQELLGHSRLETTALYVAVTGDDLAAAVAAAAA